MEAPKPKKSLGLFCLPLQCYEGEDKGVLPNGADDEEDADEHELVKAGLDPPGRGPVEQVDADQEQDDQQGHPARHNLMGRE